MSRRRQFENQQPDTTPRVIIPVSRKTINPQDIQILTRDTRAEQLQVEVYRNPRDNWYKVNVFHTCDCGRYYGYTVQQPLRVPEEEISQHIDQPISQPIRVVDLTTPPPQPSRDDSIISVNSSANSSLLVELYSLPYLSDESVAPQDSTVTSNSVQASTSSHSTERMSIDDSLRSNES